MSRARFGRRLAVVVTVMAAVLTAAGMLTPALAATGPSMTPNDGAVNIAVQGPNDSLLFYWAVNGSATWNRETVANPFTTFSAPSVAVDGNDVNIAVEGPNNSLLFYWAVNGSPTWHEETVAGAGTTFSAPSMVTDGNDVDIAVEGPSESLLFYWAVNGSPGWNAETVSGLYSDAGAPSMIVNGNTVDIAVTGAFFALYFFWAFNGSPTWHEETVVTGSVTRGGIESPPSIAASGSEIDIAAIDTNGAMNLFWATAGTGTWTDEIVGGIAQSDNAPSIAFDNGNLNIARALGSTLEFYWSSNVTSPSYLWSETTVAPDGTVASAPSMTVYGTAVNISAVGTAGQLLFYWAEFGSSTWNPETIAGPGSVLLPVTGRAAGAGAGIRPRSPPPLGLDGATTRE